VVVIGSIPGFFTGVGQRCRGLRAAFWFPCRWAWAAVGSIRKGSNVVRYLFVIPTLLLFRDLAGRPAKDATGRRWVPDGRTLMAWANAAVVLYVLARKK
jgi:hypothetical protein